MQAIALERSKQSKPYDIVFSETKRYMMFMKNQMLLKQMELKKANNLRKC